MEAGELKQFNVAFLIMGHKNRNQIARLVSLLESPNSTCFVHIDRDSDNIDVSKLGGVPICDRLHGTLSDFSLVQIAERLMREAAAYEKDHEMRYSYFCLVSGQDYPLVPVARMIQELKLNYPKPFIDCTPWSSSNWVGTGSANCLWFNSLMRRIDRQMGRGLLRKVIKSPFFVLNRLMRRAFSVKNEVAKKGVDLFGGSAWWILPDTMVDYLLDMFNEPQLRDKFLPVESVAVPEENYFQTVLMNSSFRNQIEVNPVEMVNQNCKTFANFSPPGKPFTGHPYIFSIDDAERLKRLAENHFFARKFDETLDTEILNWIDSHLLG